ncbi:MAG: DoxX family membrane protein [Bacteroidetes bacterium]|nr:DoxX family membrane protein [Bacteroidota bacterium]
MNFIENRLFRIATRVFVGIIFIVSAVLKILSMDSFEIYIYSFGLLKLNTAFYFARLVVSLELFLGVLLLLGFYARKAILTSILILFLFSLFILFLLLDENSEHCHCFGDFVELSHMVSVAKNLFLIVLLAFCYPLSSTKLKYKKYISLFLLIVSISLPIIISPPDSFMHQFYANKISYNQSQLDEYLAVNQHVDGKKIICFFGATCRFCKLASKKISVVLQKAGKDELVHYVFFGNSSEIDLFFEETNTSIFPNSIIPVSDFLKITDGQMPLILLMENNQVIKKYGYRDIDENEIIEFLQN